LVARLACVFLRIACSDRGLRKRLSLGSFLDELHLPRRGGLFRFLPDFCCHNSPRVSLLAWFGRNQKRLAADPCIDRSGSIAELSVLFPMAIRIRACSRAFGMATTWSGLLFESRARRSRHDNQRQLRMAMEKTALPDGHGGYLLNRLPLCDFVDGISGQLNKLLVQPAWPSDLDFFFIMASVQRRCPFDLALASDYLVASATPPKTCRRLRSSEGY
jgi:hypothetical protein